MINTYAKKEDYLKYGCKKIKDDEINKFLELASIDVNNATLTRIEKRGFNNLTDTQKDLIIKATCMQADYIQEAGTYDNDDIESFSIGGDLSINKKISDEMSDKLKLSKLAYMYLKRTGLINRII